MQISVKKLIISFITFVSIVAVILGGTFALGFFQEGSGNIAQNQVSAAHALRMQAIQQLIDNKFDRFLTMPFGAGNDSMHLSGSQIYPNFPEYIVNTDIEMKDDLDILLEKNIGKKNLVLSVEEIKQLHKVYLFKTQKDLKDLGYVVSSYRTRTNNDAAWRRDNISISYRNIGNVRVLNTQQQFSFMDEIHYDPAIKNWKRDTVSGLAIMGGVTSVKGGGICGASRGINTVLLTNKAFDITQRYNHTRTYKNMYQNSINGKEFWIPGLDVAVYRMGGGTKDFKFKNIREYPVVLVMNYDGSIGGQEELFVLSHQDDRGELTYLGKKGNCYSWEANGVPFRSCYNSVSRS